MLETARDEIVAEKGIKLFGRLRGIDGEGSRGRPGECYFEWQIGPANEPIKDNVFVEGWSVFLDKLRSAMSE